MDSYFSSVFNVNPRISPGSPKNQRGTFWASIRPIFIKNRWNFNGFKPPKPWKNTPKNLHQNVSNFSDLFCKPPGPGISANHFPRSKYSSLKVSDYLRKPCFLTCFFEVFFDVFNWKKTTKIKKSKNTSNLLNFRQFHRHFRIQREISVRTVGSKVHGSSFWKIFVFIDFDYLLKKYFSLFWVVFQYFWYQNRGFRARDQSLDLRLEIPLRMVKFSFQNSLMAPSYDPNTGPKNAAKNHDHA